MNLNTIDLNSALAIFFFAVAAVSAVAALWVKNLRSSVVLFSAVGLCAVVIFALMQAPDVALTEAVIGAGLATLVLLVGVSKTRITGDYDE
jgi:energy-converting hydrogenase B subunit D